MRARDSSITAQGVLSLVAIAMMLGYAIHAMQLAPQQSVTAYAQDRQPPVSATQQAGPDADKPAVFAGRGSLCVLGGCGGAAFCAAGMRYARTPGFFRQRAAPADRSRPSSRATTATRSCRRIPLDSAFTRTHSCWRDRSVRDCSNSRTRARAAGSCATATESSRSRINASAPEPTPLACLRSLSPGTNSRDRNTGVVLPDGGDTFRTPAGGDRLLMQLASP